jgi:hypothetical protein
MPTSANDTKIIVGLSFACQPLNHILISFAKSAVQYATSPQLIMQLFVKISCLSKSAVFAAVPRAEPRTMFPRHL